MSTTKRVLTSVAMSLLVWGSAVNLLAQQRDQSQRDRMSETTITGCLNKDAGGSYTLTDKATGVKTMVSGSPDLEKHSTNHEVTLTGTMKTENGRSEFVVTKLQHIAASCSEAK
jgi:hypothetical protein